MTQKERDLRETREKKPKRMSPLELASMRYMMISGIADYGAKYDFKEGARWALKDFRCRMKRVLKRSGVWSFEQMEIFEQIETILREMRG